MSLGIKYDNNNVVIEIRRSIDSNVYSKQINSLVFTDRTSPTEKEIEMIISKVEQKYLLRIGNTIKEMTQIEKDAVDKKTVDVLKQNQITLIDNLNIKTKDIIIALIKIINLRIPNNPISKTELISKIKLDKGIEQ